jgi:hypothetical protein
MARRIATGISLLIAFTGFAFAAELPAGPAIATPAPGRTFKIQLGEHFLLGDTGLVPASVPGSSASHAGVMAGLSALFLDTGRWAGGVGGEIEANRLDVGPAFPATGNQVFGLVTVRVLAQAEWRLRHRSGNRFLSTEPYVILGAGWNWNLVGTKITWLGSTPDGAALHLDLDSSPAVRVGFGVHQRATHAGLYVHAETGWKYNAGGYRMTVEGSPDHTSRFDLSGPYVLVGLTLAMSVL